VSIHHAVGGKLQKEKEHERKKKRQEGLNPQDGKNLNLDSDPMINGYQGPL